MAEKYQMPIVCFIDTPGSLSGRRRRRARAGPSDRRKHVPDEPDAHPDHACVVIGEGGSGGALGIGVGDRVAVLQYAYYSVISPEGCAGILWKSHQHAPKAADALRFTSRHLRELGVVDDVIEEPLGGAHRDHHKMAARMKSYLVRMLAEL
jgi:acetyl-CoA carboxylase carboxyl transferase subunit alpha